MSCLGKAVDVAKAVVVEGMKAVVVEGAKAVDMEGAKAVVVEGAKAVNVEDAKAVVVEGAKAVDVEGAKVVVVEGTKVVDTKGVAAVGAQGEKTVFVVGEKGAEGGSNPRLTTGSPAFDAPVTGIEVILQQGVDGLAASGLPRAACQQLLNCLTLARVDLFVTFVFVCSVLLTMCLYENWAAVDTHM